MSTNLSTYLVVIIYYLHSQKVVVIMYEQGSIM